MMQSNSYVALKSHNTSLDVGMIMTSYRSRVTENAALAFPVIQTGQLSELTIVHIRLIVLERVGLNPLLYPTARLQRRHQRPIPLGKELWNWISKQPDVARHGITPDDVCGLLVEARRIIELFGERDFDITRGFKWLPYGKDNNS